MFLQKNLLKASQSAMAAKRAVVSTQNRDYFSVFEKIKDRINTPMRHIKSFVEPDGYNY